MEGPALYHADANLLIVSDLHLSEGWRPETGKLSRLEDFLADEAFADFLAYYRRTTPDGRPWRLVLGGDLLDFLQVVSPPAANPEELAAALEALRARPSLSAWPVARPEARRRLACRRLRQGVATLPASTGLSQVIHELLAWGQGLDAHADGHVWALERLAFEACILAGKPGHQLSASDRAYGLGTSALETCWKLDRIAEGHPRFFHALAAFLQAGHCLEVVRGNHDVELYWPAVQARFRRLLEDACLAAAGVRQAERVRFAGGQVRFHALYYFERGRLYVEHGHQYEAGNAIDDVLDPRLPGRQDLIRLPPGSFFVRYFFNRLEQVFPFADNVRPQARFVAWALDHAFWPFVGLLVRSTPALLKFAWSLSGRALLAGARARGEAKPPQPPSGPLGQAAEARVADLARRLRGKPARRLRSAFLQALPLLAALGVAAGVAGLVLLPALAPRVGALFAGEGLRGYLVRAAAVALALWLANKLLAPLLGRLSFSPDYLVEAAAQLQALLKKPQEGGPRLFVFGHNHHPDFRPLEGGAWYVNTGCWLSSVGEVEGWQRLDLDFTFLEIVGEGGAPPALRRWNPQRAAPERIRLREDPA